MFHFNGYLMIFLFFNQCIFALFEDEPICRSRFDYEYKVLQKLVDLETKVQEQQRDIKTIKDQLKVLPGPQDKVAFSAYLSADMTGVPNHRVLVYDEVQTNVGDAYNRDTGIFVCRVPGVYVFYWVTTNKDRTYMDSELIVNGQEKSQAFSDAGGHDDYAVASNVVTVILKFGDQVWIRSGTWHNGKIGGERRSSFSGWLLYSL